MNKNPFMVATGDRKAMRIDQLPEEAWTALIGEAGDVNAREFYKSIPWFQRAVVLRAQAMAQMPFEILRGDQVVDSSEDYEGVFEWLPHPTWLLHMTEASLVISGEAYFERIRNQMGERMLKYMVPASITPQYSKTEGLTGFKRRVSGDVINLDVEDVLYFWLPDPHMELGPGTPPAMAALHAADVLSSVDKFAELYFKRGAVKATILKLTGVQEQQREKIRSWWRRFFSGVDNAHQAEVFSGDKIDPVVVGEGIAELSDVTLTREKREDISTAFGIPRSILFSDDANFATAQQHRKNFYEDTVVPQARFIEHTLNKQLFEPLQLRWRFLPQTLDVFQEDENQRAQSLLNYVNAGIDLDIAVRLLGLDMSEDDMERLEIRSVPQEKDEERGETGRAPSGKDAPEIFGYHLEQGVVTRNEARDFLGLEPKDESETERLSKIMALLSVVKAAVDAGIPTALAVQLAGLDLDISQLPERDESDVFAPEGRTAMVNDLRLWEKHALKKIKRGRDAGARVFESDNIPMSLAGAIHGALQEAKTDADVRAVFADMWMGYP